MENYRREDPVLTLNEDEVKSSQQEQPTEAKATTETG